MSGNFTTWREEADQVFGRVLPLIDSALTHQYGLARDEATEVEGCLYEWFHGFVRRPGTPRTDETLRPHLIMMACQAAHVYRSGKLSERSPVSEDVRRSLALGPQQIAIELEKADKKQKKNDGEPGSGRDGEERS